MKVIWLLHYTKHTLTKIKLQLNCLYFLVKSIVATDHRDKTIFTTQTLSKHVSKTNYRAGDLIQYWSLVSSKQG